MHSRRASFSALKSLLLLAALAALLVPAIPLPAQDVGVTNDSIKIGTFAPYSGPVAPQAGNPVQIGQKLVYDMVNEKGGIHGRKLVVIEEDDGCDPPKAIAAAKKLIHEHRVFLIQAATCSNAALAAKPLIVEAKIPFIASGATAIGITFPTNPYVYTSTITSDIEAESQVDFAMSVPNVKRVAVIGHRDAWGLAKIEPAIKRLKEQYNLEPVANEVLNRDANDSTAQILRLKAARPDVVILVLYIKEAAVFLRDAVKYGLDTVFVGPYILEDIPKTISLAGTDAFAKNMFAVTINRYTVDEPPMQQVMAEMKARYPNVVPLSVFTANHSAASVVVEGLRRAGRDLTRERFLAELDRLKDFEDGGLLPGTITFTPENHRGRRTTSFVTFKDGRLVNVGPKYVPSR
jgi:branched-chain amino acid transport system substrate-binding protein